jgi:hypothetical protein
MVDAQEFDVGANLVSVNRAYSYRSSTYIQDVPGGKISILGGHENFYMNVCLIPNGFRATVISLYNSEIVDKK